MCKAEKETGDHVLLHCMEAHILWQLIFALFDEQWVMHTKVRRMLLSWGGCFVGKKKKEKGLEDCSFILFFGPFGVREIGEHLKIVKAWTKQLKVLFSIFLGLG